MGIDTEMSYITKPFCLELCKSLMTLPNQKMKHRQANNQTKKAPRNAALKLMKEYKTH